MTRVRPLPHIAAAGYRRHMLHDPARTWIEKNCYVDVCIELLHALGLEPLAAMGATAAVDFEGDNFTFFKPLHNDLRSLYGVDVQELNVWRPIVEHAALHLGAGKFVSTEADAFFLPDTDGTDYRRNHVKTTIILADLDVEARRLGYFHNAGYYELAGDDFASLFRLDATPDPEFLPLFAELIRIDRVIRRPPEELARIARALLVEHLSRRPAENPMRAFERRFAADLPELQQRGMAHYHGWAFATVRQMGAAFELLALHLRWLAGGSDGDIMSAALEFDRVSSAAKTLILKGARTVRPGRPVEASATFTEMADGWQAGMTALDRALARDRGEVVTGRP
ncbi:MAG: DUF1839 family protein [Gemmatimonadales bacterium]